VGDSYAAINSADYVDGNMSGIVSVRATDGGVLLYR
jgi:hypothetical protein